MPPNAEEFYGAGNQISFHSQSWIPLVEISGIHVFLWIQQFVHVGCVVRSCKTMQRVELFMLIFRHWRSEKQSLENRIMKTNLLYIFFQDHWLHILDGTCITLPLFILKTRFWVVHLHLESNLLNLEDNLEIMSLQTMYEWVRDWLIVIMHSWWDVWMNLLFLSLEPEV